MPLGPLRSLLEAQPGTRCLFVVGDKTAIPAGDIAAANRLIANHDMAIQFVSDEDAVLPDTAFDFVYVSDSSSGATVGGKYGNSTKPMFHAEVGAWNIAGQDIVTTTYVDLAAQTTIDITAAGAAKLGVTAGTVTVFSASMALGGVTASEVPAAADVAATASSPNAARAAIILVEPGDVLLNAHTAEARRIYWRLPNGSFTSLTTAGFALWDAIINWLNPTTGQWLDRRNIASIPGLVSLIVGTKATPTTPGSAVTLVDDLSANNNDLSNANAAQRPTFTKTPSPGLSFDGADLLLSNASASLPSETLVVGLLPTVTTGWNAIRGSQTAGAAGGNAFMIINDHVVWSRQGIADTLTSTGTVPVNTLQILSGTYSPTRARVYRNGALDGTVANPTAPATGQITQIGAGYNAGDNFDGSIYVIAQYNRELSDAELARVHSEIADYLGLPSTSVADYVDPSAIGGSPALKLYDNFSRTSTTTPGTAVTGQAWVPVVGTWGTDGSNLYSVTAVDANYVTINTESTILPKDLRGRFTLAAASGTYFARAYMSYQAEHTGYWIEAKADGSADISRSFTLLGQLSAGTVPVGATVDWWRREVPTGTQITIWVNGVQKFDFIDTTASRPLDSRVGFRHGSTGTANIRWGDIAVYDGTYLFADDGVGTTTGAALNGSQWALGLTPVTGGGATYQNEKIQLKTGSTGGYTNNDKIGRRFNIPDVADVDLLFDFQNTGDGAANVSARSNKTTADPFDGTAYNLSLGNGTPGLYRFATFNSITLATAPSFTIVDGVWYSARFQVIGTTIRARMWLLGAPEPSTWNIGSVTDATVTAAGQIHFVHAGGGAGGNTLTLDNVQATVPAVASAPQTASPALVTSTPATQAPSVTAVATVTPDLVTSTPATQAPSVTAVATVAPALVTSAPALFAPTIIAPAPPITAVPDVVTSTPSVLAPVAGSITTVSPAVVTSTPSTSNPALTGATTVSPALLVSAPAVLAPAVTGAITVAPAFVTVGTTLALDASLSTTVTVAPALAVSTPTVPAPDILAAITLVPDSAGSALLVNPPTIQASITVAPDLVTSDPAVFSPDSTISFAAIPVFVASAPALFNPSMSGATTVSPALLTVAPAIQPPTITGAITVSPALVTSTPSTSAPTIATGTTVSPALVTSTPSTSAPTLGSAVTVSPALVTSAPTIAAPSITARVTAVPAAWVYDGEVFDPNAVVGKNALPDTVDADTQVFPPTLVGGPTSLVAGGLTSAPQVFAPTIQATLTARPPLLTSAPVLWGPSVSAVVIVAPATVVSSPAVQPPSVGGGIVVSPAALLTTPGVFAPTGHAVATVTPAALLTTPGVFAPALKGLSVVSPTRIDSVPAAFPPHGPKPPLMPWFYDTETNAWYPAAITHYSKAHRAWEHAPIEIIGAP